MSHPRLLARTAGCHLGETFLYQGGFLGGLSRFMLGLAVRVPEQSWLYDWQI